MPEATQGGSSHRPFDCYLSIKGIKGESTDAVHKQWIEVLSFDWGVSQAAGTGGSGAKERADFTDLSISKVVDCGSPQIYSYCARGSRLSEVKLEVCTAAGDKENYFTIILREAVVASVQVSDAVETSGTTRPVEQVGFRYAKIQWEYTALSHPGARGGTMKAGWDLGSNKSL